MLQEKFDRLIVEVYVKWNGMMIIAGDFNINLNNDSGESTQRYKQILHSFSLKQHINKPTRKNKTLIDHICSNIPTKVVHSDVLHTDEISDHDMPYAILNVKKERYEQRSLQTHHVDSTLKRRGNSRFHVVSTWNPRGVFAWL